MNRRAKSGRPLWLVSALPLWAGCARAPSFDIVGSLFPAWLLCLTLGILLTLAAHWILARRKIPLGFPVLAYPSLTAFFTFFLWLVFFH